MATKTFPHAVIYNGELIPANTPIEMEEETVETKEEQKKTARGKKAVSTNVDE